MGKTMIIVHHLNNSRSQRILWLLEELGAPYEIRFYQRDAVTNLAPPELKAVHPLGKSPVIEDGDIKVAESGAIVDYLIRTYGDGRLAPPPGTAEHESYLEWLHYAEGSAMLPLMLNLYTMRLGEGAAPLKPRIDSEIDNNLALIESALAGRDYLMDQGFTGADVQMSFVGEVAGVFGKLTPYPAIGAWLDRLHARPAFKTSVAKGGAYAFA
jgi:glutathione S-transferase